ncbi:MAG TPA: hypothetical protein VNH41_11275 [Steroidobacteraceae bacterium]|nr:hypothetical protein [Steroidobacteraceae bacterium]
MRGKAHIETVTKGPSQRVRRPIAYRVVADRKEIARFEIDPKDMDAALTKARQVLNAFNLTVVS